MASSRDPASLEGRVAIVTGGGRGMGRTHCIELGRRGAKVAVFDIDDEVARETAAAVQANGGESTAAKVDVTQRAVVDEAVNRVGEQWGGIDIVVSNAGLVNDESKLEATDDEEWRRMFAVNVDGALHMSRAAIPWLRKSAAGRIIIISSQWGQVGPGHSYSYIAAKGALIAFAKNLAIEFAPERILVNAIAPGSVVTRMIPDPERELALYPNPIHRLAEPEEISYLIAFLASDQAAFITGQTIPINGGAEIVGI
jgi:NAD(P)-dependent dehydrogenase (short-subunit alcohol dehydrogenase family)